MEKPMKKSKLPKTDSIEELAAFWDTHDVTDFDAELEEVDEPVFVRRKVISIPLSSREADAVQKMARAKGLSQEVLLRRWILQHLTPRNGRNGKRRQSDRKTPKT
jgi:hypothetical protein